jgi:hypothetical protein
MPEVFLPDFFEMRIKASNAKMLWPADALNFSYLRTKGAGKHIFINLLQMLIKNEDKATFFTFCIRLYKKNDKLYLEYI